MALLRDQPDTEGWSHDRYLLAGIFDVIRENTVLTGHFKKDPGLDSWPRPGDEVTTDEPEKKKPSALEALWLQMNA